MDSLTHLIHLVFDENTDLSVEKFNAMPPRDQFQAYNLLRYEIRFRVLPGNSGADTDRLLKDIDAKLSSVLFG